MSETALAEHTETTTGNIKPRPGLRQSDLAFAVKMYKDGLTQAQIAQRLNCTQSYVSKWLAQVEDSTGNAKDYLRGQALSMAQHIVKKGRAADHVAVLKGLSVLEENVHTGLVVQIGGGSSVQVNVQLSPPAAVSVGEGEQNR